MRISFYYTAAILAVASTSILACGGAEPAPQEPVAMAEPPAPTATSPEASSQLAPEAKPEPPPEAKPADPTADAKAANMKAAETKPADAKPADAKLADTKAAAPSSIEGTLVSKTGSLIVIDVPDAAPSPGAKGTLYRQFSQQFGPVQASGWLGIADVTVKDVSGGKVRLTMNAEKSTIMVDGKKVNHFTSGTRVKLELEK
jgi:hypothetical protein